MKLLEDRIKEDGIVLEGNVLKVNSFLNHQIASPTKSSIISTLYHFDAFSISFGYDKLTIVRRRIVHNYQLQAQVRTIPEYGIQTVNHIIC